MKINKINYKGNDVITIWKPKEFLSIPITQVSGLCLTEDNKILIINDGKGWHLPGGHPEKGEDPINALKREVNEEANVEIGEIEFLGNTEIIFLNNPNKSEGENYFQSKFFAKIIKINDQKVDPATGTLFERKFIELNNFIDYIKWGDAEEIINSLKKRLKK